MFTFPTFLLTVSFYLKNLFGGKVNKSVTFKSWIESVGVNHLASKLDIHQDTILKWLAGAADPRVKYMRAMKLLSKGKLSYDAIIDRPKPKI